jgi:DNA-binding IclR family transcriptional regulator
MGDDMTMIESDAGGLVGALKLLMQSPNAGDGLTTKEIAAALCVNPQKARELLHILDEQGMLEEVVVYRKGLGTTRMVPRKGFRLPVELENSLRQVEPDTSAA